MPCCLIQIWGLPFWGILDNHFVALHTFHQNWGIQVYLCEVMWMFALLPHKHFIRIWGFKFTFVRKCGWSHCCPRIYFIRIWSFKFTFVRQCGWLPCCQAYTVPKAILWKEMFICTVRNVYQVLKKCFFTANHLAEKENFVLYIRNVCHMVFLSLQRNFSLRSSPLSFRVKSLLLRLFWLQDSSAPVVQY